MTEDVFVLATHFGVNGAFTKTVMFNSFAQTPETRKPFDADMYNRVIFPAFRTQPGAGR